MNIKALARKAFFTVTHGLGLEVKRYVPRERLYRDMDPDFFAIYDACSPYTMTSIERMYALYSAIQYIVKAKIPGDIVECGVWRGGSCMLAAKTLQHFGDTSRKIYLFDTFEGMPKPTAGDIAKDGDRLTKQWNDMAQNTHNDWCYASLEDVQRNLSTVGYPADKIEYVVGKVEETIPGTLPSSIALLRLDTDWFDSTKHEMVHLYPNLQSKGVLLIDDYGHWKGSRAAIDEAFAEKNIVPFLARIDYTGRAFIKD